MAIDFVDEQIECLDPANKEIVGKDQIKTIRLGLFPSRQSAQWRGDRYLEQEAYPFALFRLPLNRDAFRLQVGDCFVLNYTDPTISGIVCRVINIEEEDAESEIINVSAMEISKFFSSDGSLISSSPGVNTPPSSGGGSAITDLDALINLKVIEMPYALLGTEDFKIITLCDKVSGTEEGYDVYMSSDDVTYEKIGTAQAYSPAGTLVADYPIDTNKIDDAVGFQIDFGAKSDKDEIETISRAAMFGRTNLAILGDEIISFQISTLVSGVRYQIENIIRGLYDTEQVDHSSGEYFYFLDENLFGQFASSYFMTGVTKYFKFLPFNSKYTGALADATAESHTFLGRSKKPYKPENLKANSVGIRPTYTSDIVLDWAPRIRGEDAGVGDADTVTDAAPTWEGLFEIEVWVSGSKVRTATAINDDTWTYTSAMNTTDNGSLADEVLFKLRNYQTLASVMYYSEYVEQTVTKE